MAEAVGFVGLGAMGAAMAERLQAAGVPLVVCDPDEAALAPFLARGAQAGSARDVAEAAEIVFQCLPAPAVSAAVTAEVARASKARIVVETSTIGRSAVEALAERLAGSGKALVDCPVSGGPRGARAGTLAAIVSGPPGPVAAIRPLLDVVAKSVFVVGDRPGLAQVMKLVNNLISAANMASAFEALVVGAKAGLDADVMVEVINASTGRNSATVDKVPRSVLPGTFDYGARLDILYKDVTLGLAEAEAQGVPTWTLGAVTHLLRHAMTAGRGPEDFTALIRMIEGWAGVEVRSRPTRS